MIKKNTWKLVFMMILCLSISYGGYNYWVDRSSKEYVYFMYGDVKEQSNYTKLRNILTTASSRDTVHIRIQGVGGYVQTVLWIHFLSTGKNSPHVVMHVDGDVSSADAILAFAGDDVEIPDEVVFMFHKPVIEDKEGHQLSDDEICGSYKGLLDRGQDLGVKCHSTLKVSREANDLYINQVLKLLTPEERTQYDKGWDILITGKEIKKRMGVVYALTNEAT